MGGAGFPTGVKLGTDLQGGYILVNAAECEPGLRHNMVQLETKELCEKTVRGVEYCMGGGGDQEKFKNETGPAIAKRLKEEGVDAVLMTAG